MWEWERQQGSSACLELTREIHGGLRTASGFEKAERIYKKVRVQEWRWGGQKGAGLGPLQEGDVLGRRDPKSLVGKLPALWKSKATYGVPAGPAPCFPFPFIC